MVNPEDVAVALEMEDFLFRPVDQVAHMQNMLDVVMSWSGSIDEQEVKTTIESGGPQAMAGLPDVLKIPQGAPASVKAQFVVQRAGMGRYNVLRHFIFKHGSNLKRADAHLYTMGQSATFPAAEENNTWGQRKNFNAMLDRLPGFHVRHFSVARKEHPKDQQGKGWDPTPEEIRDGFAYIREHYHEIAGSSAIEAQEWVLLQTKVRSSACYGWPTSQVEKALVNMDKAFASADVDTFFPLTSHDLHPVIQDMLLPLIYAFAPLSGAMVLGAPGVGKTPLCQIAAMAWGRYVTRSKGIDRKPGYRRGKQMDVFRDKATPVYEGILLDDPSLDRIDVEDLKAFGTIHTAGHSDARCTFPKWAKGQFHALLSNSWTEDAEPPPSAGFFVDPQLFMKMLEKPFGYLSQSHRLALTKRYVLIVVGRHGLYVRAPSSDDAAQIFKFTQGDVASDFLLPGNKGALAGFYQGMDHEDCVHPDYALHVGNEYSLVCEVQEAVRQKTSEEIASWWANRTADLLSSASAAQAAPSTHRVPATAGAPASDSGGVRARADADGQYRFRLPAAGSLAPTGMSRRAFRYPLPTKRERVEELDPADAPDGSRPKRDPGSAAAGHASDSASVARSASGAAAARPKREPGSPAAAPAAASASGAVIDVLSSGDESEAQGEPPARLPRGARLYDRPLGSALSMQVRPENVLQCPDCCLLDALNAIGVPVPYDRPGPYTLGEAEAIISIFGLSFLRSRPRSAKGSQTGRYVIVYDAAPEHPGHAVGCIVEKGRAHFIDGLREQISVGHSAWHLLPDGTPSESCE
ncbi:unnamed protein product [Prorocentrum cordatum]|uniref:Uncharacterized protein n=1 Tax=Prorocentrum cordatum TaxID=2364126 RepID=A0ABN9R895_9DINO|nr:unnamed protein product [Polarella glacialis]